MRSNAELVEDFMRRTADAGRGWTVSDIHSSLRDDDVAISKRTIRRVLPRTGANAIPLTWPPLWEWRA
jgi:hypothetical protein